MRFGPSLSLVLLLVGCAPEPGGALPTASRLVDLTHPFDADTIYWPTDVRGFEFLAGSRGYTDGGYYYEAHRFAAAEHGGTHVDAPIHFFEGRSTVDAIPLDRLVAPGVRIDVTEACANDRDHAVDRSDLEAWEAAHGTIPAGSIVLLHTGFGAYWPDRARYMGTDRRGPEAVPELSFPGLDPDAARWLAVERAVAAVGIDTPSIDPGRSTSFASHVALFEHDVPALENVASLDRLPATGFTVAALPMKIASGSGAPARIVALVF